MNFFRDNKNPILLVISSLFFILLMIFSSVSSPNAGVFTDAFGLFLKPFQSFGTYVSNCFEYADNSEKYKNENMILKEQLVIANENAKNYSKLASENSRLRSMLDLKENATEMKLEAASVIGTDTENWSRILKIDKGSADGININDYVITESGLVGYVCDVGRNWANVETIIDPNSSVGAKIEKNDEYCIVDGDISLTEKKLCIMKYVTVDISISQGDIVVTSGEGGIYPEGILVGRICEIKENTDGMSQDAVIEPAVNFNELNDVLVIVG